jgi:1,4-dihydroxy-2-naphthoate octaprenyltransferase
MSLKENLIEAIPLAIFSGVILTLGVLPFIIGTYQSGYILISNLPLGEILRIFGVTTLLSYMFINYYWWVFDGIEKQKRRAENDY